MINLKNIVLFDNEKKKVNILFGLAAFMVISKLFLLDSGMMANPDEWRYLHSIRAVKMLCSGEFKECLHAVFSTDGRPGEVILKMIPAALQIFLSNMLNINILETNAFLPVYGFNFIIFLLIILIHYRFTFLITGDRIVSMLSVLLYISLTNASLYLRHNFPYDLSLLIFYYCIFSLVKVLKNKESSNTYFVKTGLLAFFAYLVYPGYVFLYVLCLGLIVLDSGLSIYQRGKNSIFFIIGGFLLLAVMEFASHLGGRSYIVNAFILSGTIIQGSFEETLIFIFKYLYQVEGFVGVLIICSIIVYSLRIFKKHSFQKQENIIFVLIILLITAHGVLGLFFHKIVFYGRLLHQYIPFFVVFTAISISQFTSQRISGLVYPVAFCLLGFSVVEIYQQCEIKFPRDYAWKNLKQHGYYNISQYYGFNNAHTAFPKLEFIGSDYGTLQELDSTGIGGIKKDHAKRKYLIINACFILPSNKSSYTYSTLHDKKGYIKVVDSSMHYINFKAYQFEGYKIEERQFLDSIKPKLYLVSKIE